MDDIQQPTSPSNVCVKCSQSLVPLPMAFFVERKCGECGLSTYLFDRDPKNSGLRILKGDTVHCSPEELFKQLKLKGGLRFYRSGLDLFARSLLLPKLNVAVDPENDLMPVLDGWAAEADAFLEASPRLQGLDLETEEGATEAAALIMKQQEIAEWSAFVLHLSCSRAKDALKKGDAWRAAGAAAMAAAAHAMLAFKREVEETVWRGHSVETLRTALGLWHNNQMNDSEEFWQQTFSSHTFVLSQVFATPVVVVAGKAYVGGKSIDNTGGGLSDFLLKNEVTSRTAIVELKVPTTPLLTRSMYRNNVYAPSPELVGAVAQVSGYAASLAEDPMLRLRSATPLEPSRSECVVLVGTAATELTDNDRRRSFELYRSELRNVRVVTYDELFSRVGALLALFGG